MTGKEISTKYLIVGNSAGGIGAAEAIREVDKEGSLTIVSEEPYPAYSRPLISEYLAGECSVEKMLFRPADFYIKKSITSLPGKKVRHLELGQRLAELESGERIFWEKLLLACGGVPFVPPISGREKEGVFTFTTLEDAKQLDKALTAATRVVVIGGGLIGLSVAEALVKRKAKVTIVELRERVLSTILDETASRLMEAVLEEAGIEIITGGTVKEILGKPGETNTIAGVVLDNGTRVPCDLVIIAIGVVPRLELVRDTTIEVKRGIVVDRFMATSVPDVYACGDVAEAYDFVYDTNRLTPIWPNAYIGGRIAGYNMAGLPKEYPGGTTMNSLKYFGLPVISAGIMDPQNGQDYEIVAQAHNQSYAKVVLRRNTVVGMIFVTNIDVAGIIFGLMRDKVNVRDFKDSLLTPDFSFASFPLELRERRIGQLSPKLAHPVAILEEVKEAAAD